jgi:hypothetical protein
MYLLDCWRFEAPFAEIQPIELARWWDILRLNECTLAPEPAVPYSEMSRKVCRWRE